MQAHDASFTLFMIDMDNFKQVNDTLGHQVGDNLLKAASDRLIKILRSNDKLYRIGGDEFALILDNCVTKQAIVSIAEKLIEAISPAFKVQGHEIYMSASLGSCVYPVDALSKEDLMKNADTAMYYAKRHGKCQHVFFKADMNAINIRRHNLEAALREALDKNEIEFHFQPQFDQTTKRIVGAEALVRWNSEELGYISPLEFIPIAEDSGLISNIGKLALERSCQQLQAWHRQGYSEMKVAVNVSERQLHETDFVEYVRTTLESYDLSPESVELELTESILMEDDPEVLRQIEGLHQLGILLAIDDFGTGYSSLSYIKRFPIGKIKIDQAFVKDIPEDEENCAIAKAIISFSKSLHLQVIAEGVETEDQVQFLEKEGCVLVQGYYFGKPMVAEQLTRLLQTSNGSRNTVFLREVNK